MTACVLSLVVLLAVASAQPTDPVILKLDEQQYHQVADGDGNLHRVDLWLKASDLEKMARYNPESDNVYHLFTRSNPSVSQVLLLNSPDTVIGTNYDASKRTGVVIHGWLNSATSDVNTVIVPGFLSSEDMNVIVVDWSAGANNILDYGAAVVNTVPSGESVASFITWLNSVTGGDLSTFHIVGHSLGGHQAGIVGRNLGGLVPYVTALDPAMLGWVNNEDKFTSTDGIYTEVIHTNAGVAGYLTPLGDTDFYPNGGVSMTGCDGASCDHGRSFFYFGESLATGGFTSSRCSSYLTAIAGTCFLLPGPLNMGGITPKTGESGIFHLDTNAAQPFSQG